MSVSGVSTTNLFNLQSSNPPTQTSFQKAQAEFQQLGSALQSGNLSAAQSDYSTLQGLVSQSGFASKVLQGDNPIGKAFTQLGQDLKSGNLAGAQQDYSTIRQDFQNLPHHHGGTVNPGTPAFPVNQLFDQLGSELQSSDLSTAQQTYNSLTQQLSQGQTPANAQVTPGSSVSVSI
jgi:outer membrane protein assembly factor BamD (BamD/ComL family)